MVTETTWAPIADLVVSVQAGTQTAKQLVEESLRRIEAGNPTYSAIITTIPDAIKKAELIDARIKSGDKIGVLAGVPFIAKDNFLVFGTETTAASNMLKGFVAPYQATAIERLEAAGAICVAKANLDAFAHGGSTENSDWDVTKNPHDTTRVPGGSSGGSAAAVALHFAPFALGTDTGGSIRQPASFCGIVGLKPTYGLVSRSGVVAMASSTDVIGPMTTSVTDAAVVLDVLAGIDELDSTTIEREAGSYTELDHSLTGMKIGIVEEYFSDAVSADVKQMVQAAADELKKQGAELVPISLPSLPLALAVYYIVVPAELSSNLARYDGQRYQFSATETTSLEESYEKSRSLGFGAEAKRRIMIGAHVLSSGYYDAYYKKAQTVRTKLRNEFAAAFETVDVLLGPVTPSTAFKIGENSHDPMQMYVQDIMTVAANLVGIPAISVPCGEIEGLPVGLQLMAPMKQDKLLLQVAAAYERSEVV